MITFILFIVYMVTKFIVNNKCDDDLAMKNERRIMNITMKKVAKDLSDKKMGKKRKIKMDF